MDEPYSYGEGHDWHISHLSWYVCEICHHLSNENPPYKCPGHKEGLRVWAEKVATKNPGKSYEDLMPKDSGLSGSRSMR